MQIHAKIKNTWRKDFELSEGCWNSNLNDGEPSNVIFSIFCSSHLAFVEFNTSQCTSFNFSPISNLGSGRKYAKICRYDKIKVSITVLWNVE